MKWGYKHKTGIIGADAEYYASRLFMMIKNPNGSRRPDLISPEISFDYPISIELKSGKGKKGVMVDYQLHYALNTSEDYFELFNKLPPKVVKEDLFGKKESSFFDSESRIPYYYDVLDRPDKIMSEDLSLPFSSIKLSWGDHHIVPNYFAFYNFAIRKHLRTGGDLKLIIQELEEMIKLDAQGDCHDYKLRKEDAQSWQNLEGGDVLAVYHDLDFKKMDISSQKKKVLNSDSD